MILTTENQITQFQTATLIGALKLEKLGMKRKGPSALATCKKLHGIKARTAADALPQMLALYAEKYGREYGS